jgi:WD40 repeat protein
VTPTIEETPEMATETPQPTYYPEITTLPDSYEFAVIDRENANELSIIDRISTAGGSVYNIAWSPDSKHVGTGGASGDIFIYSPGSGELETVFAGNSIYISDVVFSPDGAKLAASKYDGTIQTWKVEDFDANVHEYETLETGSSAKLYSLDWSPNGLLIAATNQNGSLFIWNALTGELLHTFSIWENDFSVSAVRFSPDSLYLAVSGIGNILIWDLRSEQAILNLEEPTDTILSIDWSPDGHTLIAGGLENQVFVWDIESGELIEELSTQHAIYSVVYSKDGSLAAIGFAGKSTILLDTSDWSLIHDTELIPFRAYGLAFSPNGKYLALVDSDPSNGLVIWGIPIER